MVPAAVEEQLERALPGGGTFDLCPWGTGMGYFDVCLTSTVMLPRRVDASHFIALWLGSPVVPFAFVFGLWVPLSIK